MKQDLLGKNKYFRHFLRYEWLYLPLAGLMMMILPIMLNFLHRKPLLIGEESYYYLSSVWASMFFSAIPSWLYVGIPLVLGIISLLLLLLLLKRLRLSSDFIFIFLSCLIVSPAFIFTFSTISAYLFFLPLALTGLLLLTLPKALKYCSLPPFIIATFFDLFTASIILLLQLFYFFAHKKERKIIYIIGITSLFFIINMFLLAKPLVLGPFHHQQLALDLMSDMGGLQGIGFTFLLLAGIGLVDLRKKKEFMFITILLFFLIVGYIYSTEVVFFLALLIIFLAATGFKAIFERVWNFPLLKRFTFLLIILSILFSTLTYFDRIGNVAPSPQDKEALGWMKQNTPETGLVFSAPENGYYIKYFAARNVFYEPHQNDKAKAALTEAILNSTYISTTFPLLEEQGISLIYITPDMKEQHSPSQGLFFLLQNERFKLLYSNHGYEVWEFKPNNPGENS